MSWLPVDGCGCGMCLEALERIAKDRRLLDMHRREVRAPLEREYQKLLNELHRTKEQRP